MCFTNSSGKSFFFFSNKCDIEAESVLSTSWGLKVSEEGHKVTGSQMEVITFDVDERISSVELQNFFSSWIWQQKVVMRDLVFRTWNSHLAFGSHNYLSRVLIELVLPLEPEIIFSPG